MHTFVTIPLCNLLNSNFFTFTIEFALCFVVCIWFMFDVRWIESATKLSFGVTAQRQIQPLTSHFIIVYSSFKSSGIWCKNIETHHVAIPLNHVSGSILRWFRSAMKHSISNSVLTVKRQMANPNSIVDSLDVQCTFLRCWSFWCSHFRANRQNVIMSPKWSGKIILELVFCRCAIHFKRPPIFHNSMLSLVLACVSDFTAIQVINRQINWNPGKYFGQHANGCVSFCDFILADGCVWANECVCVCVVFGWRANSLKLKWTLLERPFPFSISIYHCAHCWSLYVLENGISESTKKEEKTPKKSLLKHLTWYFRFVYICFNFSHFPHSLISPNARFHSHWFAVHSTECIGTTVFQFEIVNLNLILAPFFFPLHWFSVQHHHNKCLRAIHRTFFFVMPSLRSYWYSASMFEHNNTF